MPTDQIKKLRECEEDLVWVFKAINIAEVERVCMGKALKELDAILTQMEAEQPDNLPGPATISNKESTVNRCPLCGDVLYLTASCRRDQTCGYRKEIVKDIFKG